jgi:replicative DNA helicase
LSQIFDACDNLSKRKFFIQDTPNMQLSDIRSQARKMKREDDIQILFIDYIGLIQNTDNTVPRHEQIANISRTLKQLTRELNIPIVVLSQVGRQTDGQLPRLADLRESGSIEQDADIVILLHRNNAEETIIQKTEVLVAKNRNGETGKINLGFHRNIVRFEELSNDYNSN